MRSEFIRIRIGSINPDQSYEEKQGGMHTELEAELGRRQSADGALESMRADLRNFRYELINKGWPFCAKATVVREIDVILRNYSV